MPKSRKNIQKNIHTFLPRGLLKFFAVAAFLLVPWSIILWQSLPSDHLDRRWNMAWTGFDIALIVSLGLTAFLGLKKSGWVIIPASMAAALLVMDAWFDCLTAKQGWEYIASLSLASFIEIPMAGMAIWIAYCAGRVIFQTP